VQRSHQLEDQIKSSQQKLKSDANLRKQIETELTYYERQHPIIQANLKISENAFNQFVSDYFQKFVKDMQEVQGYFSEKIIAADQKDFEAFFEIMSIFDFKLHTDLNWLLCEIPELEAIREMVMGAGDYILIATDGQDSCAKLMSLVACIETFKTIFPKNFQDRVPIEESVAEFSEEKHTEKIRGFFEKFENCGKKFLPLYGKLFNEHLYGPSERTEKIETRKKLFKDYVRSQMKFLEYLYSHIIKRHNHNRENLTLMEKIQTLESSLTNLARDRNSIMEELMSLQGESKNVAGN
jgi:hypothetical protein